MRHLAAAMLILLVLGCQNQSHTENWVPKTVDVFSDNMIHFSLENPREYETVRVTPFDNGREIQTQIHIPEFSGNVKITARMELRPIPKDMLSVHDPWDRAGHVRLVLEDGPDVELMKFMTAYGGKTNWEIDISHLAPLLRGTCIIAGFIDTWVSPAWRMDFSITFEPGEVPNPIWAAPLFYVPEYTLAAPGNDGVSTDIRIPEGLEQISLYYLVSGHCTDGRGADEFEPKDNVFYLDGSEIFRLQPWRDDCLQFRAINPYTKHWSTGDWSSDFSRSGWCPGDTVEPLQLGMTDLLPPGDHELKLVIENVRGEDENGHMGYWRSSAVLLGW